MGQLKVQSEMESFSFNKVTLSPTTPQKKLLLLDMDETLLHAATLPDIYEKLAYGPDASPTFTASFKDQDLVIEVGVFVRPFLKEMLSRLVPLFDICVYTASEKVYADAILQKIDPKGIYFKRRLYRDKCTRAVLDNGKVVYVKDLRYVEGYDLSRIVIVDNSLLSFAFHPENGIPISNYFYDP